MVKKWLVTGVAVLALLALAACGSLGRLGTTAVAEGPAAAASAEGEVQAAESPAAAAPAAELGGGGGGGGIVSSDGSVAEGVVVVGTGTASAEPEVAQVTFGVELRGDDPAQKIDRALAAVGELGVASDDIKTTGYSLWVETIYDPESGTPTGEVVYHVSHYVQVTLHEPAKVGSLLAAVVEAGANTISGVNFTVEDTQALVDEARRKAAEDAQSRAQAIAGALGIELGKPLSVTESSGTGDAMYRTGIGGGAADVAAPAVAPGSFSVSVSVQVIYEIR